MGGRNDPINETPPGEGQGFERLELDLRSLLAS